MVRNQVNLTLGGEEGRHKLPWGLVGVLDGGLDLRLKRLVHLQLFPAQAEHVEILQGTPRETGGEIKRVSRKRKTPAQRQPGAIPIRSLAHIQNLPDVTVCRLDDGVHGDRVDLEALAVRDSHHGAADGLC